MARLNTNAAMREIFTSGAVSGALDGMLVSLYLIILMILHPVIGLMVLVLGGLRVLLFLALRRRLEEMTSRFFDAEAASRGYQGQMLAGIETLKSLGAERRAVEHWSNLFADELNIVLRRGRLSATFDSLLAALTAASPFVILAYGALEVIRGELTLGTMLAVSALAAGFFAPLSTLVASALQIQMLGTYFERIDDVLEAPPEQERGATLARPRLKGRIALDRVSFRYSPASPLVVDDVSLDIEAGSFVALVGPSGAARPRWRICWSVSTGLRRGGFSTTAPTSPRSICGRCAASWGSSISSRTCSEDRSPAISRSPIPRYRATG